MSPSEITDIEAKKKAKELEIITLEEENANNDSRVVRKHFQVLLSTINIIE